MQISLQRYSDICLSLSGWAFVLAVFFAPFSTASLNTLTILGFVLWFISGRFPQHCRLLARNTICRTLFVFVALLTVSTLWSTTTLEMALDGLKSYRKILFFFAVFGIVWFLPQWKEKILWASLISGVVSALACVCVYLHVPGFPAPDPGQGAIFMKNHITQGFLMGLLVLLSVRVACFYLDKKVKLLGLLATCLAIFVSFYTINGRTGFLSVGVAAGSLVLFLPQTFKQEFSLFALIAIIMASILATSDRFQDRFIQATEEIELYTEEQAPVKQKTSMGLRLLFWERGLDIVQKAPFFGHGVGSWSDEFDRDQLEDGIKKGDALYQVCGNPHNDYIMVAAQVGVMGLMIWLLFLGLIYRFGKLMPLKDSFLLHGFLLMYLAGCLFNSFTYDVTEGTLLFILTACLLAPYFRETRIYE